MRLDQFSDLSMDEIPTTVSTIKPGDLVEIDEPVLEPFEGMWA